MNIFPSYPKLRNRRTGAEIELNANPFSLGRGLSCNYVIPSKTVSRVHCILQMNDDNTWVLRDSSTNGTFVNGKLVKHVKSPPLKDNDVICLEINSVDSYVFVNEAASNDISDEQLCAIADSVLNEMECLTSNPTNASGQEQLGAASLPPRRNAPDSTTVNPLLDHMYTAKSSNEAAKKARVGRSPRPILGCGNRRDPDDTSRLGQGSATSARDEAATRGSEPVRNNVLAKNDGNSSNAGSNKNNASQGGSTGSMRVDQEVVSLTQSSGHTAQSDGVGRNEEIVVSSSQNSSNSAGSGEGAACLAQPGPSTIKTDKPPEQTDNYEVMENELQCVICSELFVKALTLNCSHTFCKYCIRMWNKNKSDCPICRTKITSMTSTIVLDNVIEKVIETSNEEIKQHRRSVLEERRKQEEAESQPPAGAQQQGRRGRGRGRGGGTRRARGGRGNRTQDDQPRINVLDPVAINIGALVNNVIELSSDSDWSTDTESMSPNDMQDEYDHDDWWLEQELTYHYRLA
ncbi:E3 ubiquitin-protein ligase CHFR-like isoform X2 [Anoplophora glabripennis]|uniref:E3 ubiquitin-protein ligase CHFR-like isoform X2 n=1 Tax=Anoplophora glabripennis TaxID=217634 RepID=UPI000874DF30|nr:E3 ubiquitin-protein ligase CHFR-like isoform X2 [Anoplophora glabripennis]